ncbi:MAG TPA: hypothetical protein VN513_01900 [Gemmatimonadales bacterium]|nr:hypothetical protein [Gemmatimonadales bacterium]
MLTLVFTGQSARRIAEEIDDARDGEHFRILVRITGAPGDEHATIQAASSTYDGDPINDSHLCPGSPGCP